MYLKLKDVRWALGVEVCLKSHIYSFCCHDYHDAQVLRQIMARVIPPNGRQPSIITAKFEVSGKLDSLHYVVVDSHKINNIPN